MLRVFTQYPVFFYAAVSVAYATSPAFSECVIRIAYIATQAPKNATAVIAAGQPSRLTFRLVLFMRVGMLSAILMMLCSIVETSFVVLGEVVFVVLL